MIREVTLLALQMECDRCGKRLTDNHGAFKYDVLPAPLLEEAVKQRWTITLNGAYCPDCAKLNKDKKL